MSFESFIRDNYEIKETTNQFIRINCPFCADNKFHGYIDPKKDLYKCWKCMWSHKSNGEATTAYFFLKHVHTLSHSQILEILRGDSNILLSSRMEDSFKDTRDLIEEIFSKNPNKPVEFDEILLPHSCSRIIGSTSRYGEIAQQYINTRFGDLTIAKNLDLHYCYSGKYNGRIIIPVYYQTKLVYFQGRSFYPTNRMPKYMNPALPKPIFGLEYVEDHIYVCEGIFDAYTIGAGGIATFGTELGENQIRLLKKCDIKYATICFDPDEAGKRAITKTCYKLKAIGIDHIFAVIGLEKDPADLGDDARDIIEYHSVPFDFSLELYLKGV